MLNSKKREIVNKIRVKACDQASQKFSRFRLGSVWQHTHDSIAIKSYEQINELIAGHIEIVLNVQNI